MVARAAVDATARKNLMSNPNEVSPTVYCYATEFHDTGRVIDLISIGIVCEDGREYYAVNQECNFSLVRDHDWLWNNVALHLPTITDDQGVTSLDREDLCVKPGWRIVREVSAFLLASGPPELWAYYSAHNHVALTQLWGTTSRLPEGVPHWTHDLKQLLEQMPDIVPPKRDDQHHALAGAKWVWKALAGISRFTYRIESEKAIPNIRVARPNLGGGGGVFR